MKTTLFSHHRMSRLLAPTPSRRDTATMNTTVIRRPNAEARTPQREQGNMAFRMTSECPSFCLKRRSRLSLCCNSIPGSFRWPLRAAINSPPGLFVCLARAFLQLYDRRTASDLLWTCGVWVFFSISVCLAVVLCFKYKFALRSIALHIQTKTGSPTLWDCECAVAGYRFIAVLGRLATGLLDLKAPAQSLRRCLREHPRVSSMAHG